MSIETPAAEVEAARRLYRTGNAVVLANQQPAPPVPPATLAPTPAPDRLSILMDFLALKLPSEGPRFVYATSPAGDGSALTSRAVDSKEELARRAIAADDAGLNVFYGCATYRAGTTGRGGPNGRRQENVAALCSCSLDLDVSEAKGAAGTAYATQAEARAAGDAFAARLGLPPTHAVNSGTGIHLDWCFLESVSREVWQRAADALKAACSACGLRADPTCTADSARVLRVPTSTHRKDVANPRPTGILERGKPVLFADFCAAVGRLADLAPAAQSDLDADLFPPRTLTDPHANDPLSAGLTEGSQPLPWLMALPAEERHRALDQALAYLPASQWDTGYGDWTRLLASARSIQVLHELDEARTVGMIAKYCSLSPKWLSGEWNVARLKEKVCSFDHGSPRYIFELARRTGWEPPVSEPAAPFNDKESAGAESYFTGRFVHVARDNVYFDALTRESLPPLGLDEAHSWLTHKLGTGPRKILKNCARTRRATGFGFHPGAGPVFQEGALALANRFVPHCPPPLIPTAAEIELWRWLIDGQLFRKAEDRIARDYFLDALAFLVQHPGRRVAAVPLLIGEAQGTGKSTLLEAVPLRLFGTPNVVSPRRGEVESQFNDYASRAWVVTFPEIWFGQGRDAEKIANDFKDCITSPVLRLHPKGGKPYTVTNRTTLMGTSNHVDAVHLRTGDRRWAIHITDAPPMSADQSRALYEFLDSRRAGGVLRYLLLRRDVSRFNPAAAPPLTGGKRAVIEASRSALEDEVIALFEARDVPFHRELFTLEDLRLALRLRVRSYDSTGLRRLAGVVKGEPIHAERLAFRRRIAEARGQQPCLRNLWAIKNAEAWSGASNDEIAHHMHDGTPLPPAPFGDQEGADGAEPADGNAQTASPPSPGVSTQTAKRHDIQTAGAQEI